MEEVSNLITQQLETIVELAPWGPIMSRRKTIIALLPYTIRLGQSGKQRIVDRSLRAAMALGSETLIWDRAKPPIARLFNAQSPPSLDWLITLASPYVSWHDEPYDGEMVVRWVAAVSGVSSGVPYTEEIGQSVVGTLLHIASVDALRPRIPVDIWACLMAQPSLPPECLGRSRGSSRDVLLQIRALGDIEILKSYLLLIWSEWDSIDDQQSGGLVEMTASIREDFGGIEMWRHRQDLIGRLDHVLGQLDKGLDHLHQHKPGLDAHHISRAKTQYSELKGVLLEVDVEATDGLSGKPPRLSFFSLLTPTDTYRIPFDFRVCSASTVPVILWSTCHCFDQPLGLYTDSFPVAAFSVLSLRWLRTFQAYLDVSYQGCLLYGPVGDLLRHCSYPYVADGRLSTVSQYFLSQVDPHLVSLIFLSR